MVDAGYPETLQGPNMPISQTKGYPPTYHNPYDRNPPPPPKKKKKVFSMLGTPYVGNPPPPPPRPANGASSGGSGQSRDRCPNCLQLKPSIFFQGGARREQLGGLTGLGLHFLRRVGALLACCAICPQSRLPAQKTPHCASSTAGVNKPKTLSRSNFKLRETDLVNIQGP